MTPDQIEAREQLEALLTQVEDLKDEIALKKAEYKVASKKLDRLARKHPELAKNLGVKIDVEEDAAK